MKRMMWVLGLTLILHTTNSFADSVIRDGKEWLQPADFTNLSWNDVVAKCPAPDFVCDGELNGHDVTGYTFASIDDITELFNSFGINPPLVPALEDVSEIDSMWAPAFFLDFSPTSAAPPILYCLSADTHPDNNQSLAYGFIADDYPGFWDVVSTSGEISPELSRAWIGVCLYRDYTPPPAPKVVPTLSTYGLIFTILGFIAIASGRLFRRKFRDG